MAWTIQLFPDVGVAEVRYSGVVTYRERSEAKAELWQRIAGTGIQNILVNYNGASAAEEDVSELRHFLDDVSSTEFLRGMRTAYLCAPFEHETASQAMSRMGGYEFGSFHKRPAALSWLQET